jgi:Family of unknown function (DUF5941)
MTATVASGRSRPELTLELYRDDGPLARTLGRTLGRRIPVPPVPLILAGAVPLFVLIAIRRGDASDLLVGVVIAWAVLCAGLSSGRPHTDRLRWAVPAALRSVEYGTLVWLGALAGGTAPAAAFALLAAIAYRHYDLVYRLRYQGAAPPRWVGDVGGGWDGRLIAGYLLLLADAVPAGFYALAALSAVVFVGESVNSWARVQRSQAVGEYEDEEAGEE